MSLLFSLHSQSVPWMVAAFGMYNLIVLISWLPGQYLFSLYTGLMSTL